MPDWTCVPGGTLLIPSGKVNHLHIILNPPKDFDGYLNSSVLVNVTSIKNMPYDDTLVLSAGLHPFINTESFIAYRYARLEREEDLVQKVNARLFIPHDPLDEALLKQVQEGLSKSPFTKRFLKNFSFD